MEVGELRGATRSQSHGIFSSTRRYRPPWMGEAAAPSDLARPLLLSPADACGGETAGRRPPRASRPRQNWRREAEPQSQSQAEGLGARAEPSQSD